MRTLSRREFLRISVLTTAGTVAAACAQPTAEPEPVEAPTTEPPAPAAPTTAPAEALPARTEIPMLAELVEKGELPPMEERLPANPLVIDVYEGIGTYGGNWRRAYKGLSDRWGPDKLQEEYAIEFRMEPGGELYRVAHFYESYEVSDDGTEYTWHMREGVKWSDGEEIDTEDVQFWYDYRFMDETLTPVKSSLLTVGGEPMRLTVVDRYTFKTTFAAPHPLLISQLFSPNGLSIGPTFCMPEHYMRQFHPALTPMEEIEAVLAEYELATWDQLWGGGPIELWFLNPEMPVASAWRMRVSPLESQERIVMERNPYYWQVDPEGNQLPYIDTITHDFFDNNEVLVFKILNGEIDCQERHTSIADFTLYKENEEQGNYTIKRWMTAATSAYYPNISHPEPKYFELFNDVRFRHALSVAINRDEINTVLFNGTVTPRQASPVSGSPDFDPEFAARWAEYDPDTANALLDEIGLTNRDAEGYRTWPDGSPMAFEIANTDTGMPNLADEVNMVIRYWGEVGIKFLSKVMDRTLYSERGDANLHEFWTWPADRNLVPFAQPDFYIQVRALWRNWYLTGGKEGLEPPEGHTCWEVWALWEQVEVEPDEEKRQELWKQILEIHKENIWRIGTLGEFPALVITSNRMGNVPEGLYIDNTTRAKGLAQPAQFFLRA